jgi:hypothetical protein
MLFPGYVHFDDRRLHHVYDTGSPASGKGCQVEQKVSPNSINLAVAKLSPLNISGKDCSPVTYTPGGACHAL